VKFDQKRLRGPNVRSALISLLVVALLAGVLLALAMTKAAEAKRPASGERRATIFYTGAIRGALEPCGCTSDPLGDIARMTGVVRRAGTAAQVLLVDAGNLLYAGAEVPARLAEGADLRAAFLASELGRLPLGGVALGETDLARGPERVLPRRLAVNITGAPFVEPSRIREVGGIRIGILGLADPELVRRSGWRAEDPAEAARREAEALRQRGAEVVIAIAGLDRSQARRVARAAAVDFVVVSHNVGEGMNRADAVERAFVLAPAEDLQKLGRIDLVVRGDGGGARLALVDAGGTENREQERTELRRRLAQMDAELERWSKDATADKSFVASRGKEREQMSQRLLELDKEWQPPATGSYFTNTLVPLRRALPRDPKLASAMRRLDQKVGAANLQRAQPPPPAPPGRAAFAGDATCGRCHKQAMALWRTTVHARAWKTIVDGGKTGYDDCVSCHVTGYGEVGGSSLGHLGNLKNVQCETCHGPGSLHVAAQGLEEPPAIRRAAPESTCLRCHNEKHSDTFNYVAYLRDILGPGHGAKVREKLGPGPTGHQLRAAAVAKAKAAGQAQLKAAQD
jgi:hypothetical protein